MFKVNKEETSKAKKGGSLKFQTKIRNKIKVDHDGTVKIGNKSVSYFVPKVWNSIAQETKNAATLAAFKTKTKFWKPVCS